MWPEPTAEKGHIAKSTGAATPSGMGSCSYWADLYLCTQPWSPSILSPITLCYRRSPVLPWDQSFYPKPFCYLLCVPEQVPSLKSDAPFV